MKPKTVHHTAQGRVYRARATAGPDKSGRWRWRRQEQLQSGKWVDHRTAWARPQDAQRLLRDLHRESSIEGPLDRADGLRDLLDMWLATQEARADLAPRSLAIYTLAVAKLAPEGGPLHSIQPIDLTTRDLAAWVRIQRTNGRGDVTMSGDMRVLRMAWRWGQKQGDIPHDLHLPKLRLDQQGEEHYTPTAEEVDAVLQHLDHGPTWRLVVLGRATGARLAEMLTLRWSSVRFEGDEASIRFVGKTKRRRTPVGPKTTAELRRWRELDDAGPGDHVLRKGDRKPATRPFYMHLYASLDALKQERWSWHGLRRLAVMEMQRAGIPSPVAASITGHSVTVMHRYYTAITEADQRRAVAALDTAVVEVDFTATRKRRRP